MKLGLKGIEDRVIRRLEQDPTYRKLFPLAFAEDVGSYTIRNAVKAIAAFERSIDSTRSPYGRYRYGEADSISAAAKRGEILFFSSEKAGCFRCQGGWNSCALKDKLAVPGSIKWQFGARKSLILSIRFFGRVAIWKNVAASAERKENVAASARQGDRRKRPE